MIQSALQEEHCEAYKEKHLKGIGEPRQGHQLEGHCSDVAGCQDGALVSDTGTYRSLQNSEVCALRKIHMLVRIAQKRDQPDVQGPEKLHLSWILKIHFTTQRKRKKYFRQRKATRNQRHGNEGMAKSFYMQFRV